MRKACFLLLWVGLMGCGGHEEGRAIRSLADTEGGNEKRGYSWINQNLIKSKCVFCHASDAPSANVDLSSYSSIMNCRIVAAGDPEDSLLYTALRDAAMPPSGDKPSPEEVKAVHDWIQAGAEND